MTPGGALEARDLLDMSGVTLRDGEVRLEGRITSRMALVFRRIVTSGEEIRRVVLDSPGGDLYAALLMADDLHRLGAATDIPEGAGCYSACALVFFSGSFRSIGGELGVHRMSAGVGDFETAQLVTSDVLEAMQAYGVPTEVALVMLRTPSSEMYVFSREEVETLSLEGVSAATEYDESLAPSLASAPEQPVRIAPNNRWRRFETSVILVPTQEEARRIVERAQQGETFSDLARSHSVGATARAGGYLGWVGRGIMLPELETAIMGLQVGEISPPVETDAGWQVILLHDADR